MFRRILLFNILITLALALAAGFGAMLAIGDSVKSAIKEDLQSEVAALRSVFDEAEGAAALAAVSSEIGRRVYSSQTAAIPHTVYVLVRADGSTVVGNAGTSQQLVTQHTGWHEIDGDQLDMAPGLMIVRVQPLDGYFSIVVGRRVTSINALVWKFVPLLILTVIVLGAVSTWFMFRLDRQFRKSIAQLNTVFNDVESGVITRRAERISQPKELKQLSQHINSALNELERVIRGLDSVSKVAAHEIKRELLLLKDRLVSHGEIGTSHNLIDSLSIELDRTSLLVDHVLELARIESTPEFLMKRIDLCQIVERAVDLYQDVFEDAHVELIPILPSDACMILGSGPLFDSMVTNLLSNALAASPNESCVSVTLAQKDNQFELTVLDQGPGVSTLDVSELAQQGRSATRSREEHHGFGLLHVQAITLRHGGYLKLLNKHPGLSISITIPNAQ